MSSTTLGERVLQYNKSINTEELHCPSGYIYLNPYQSDQKAMVIDAATRFYTKYFSDNRKRRLILGSSPARRGTAITGIPFEEAEWIQEALGVDFESFHISRSSSTFLENIMNLYGGRENFYNDFLMSFVCPIGLARINENGNEVNVNYYDNKKIEKAVTPLIVSSIQKLITLGIDDTVCYCIGSSGNYQFLTKLNSKFNLFKRIVPLEHPRYITQYNNDKIEFYTNKYIELLNAFKHV